MTTPMTAEAPPEEKVLREWEKFEGDWELARGEEDGWVIPEAARYGYRLLIVGGRFSVRTAAAIHKGSIHMDPSKTPCEMDIHEDVGPFAGKTRLGIYEVGGGRLKVCLALPDQPRPTDFSAPSGSGRLLHMWKCDQRAAAENEEEFHRFEGTWSMLLEEVDGQKTRRELLENNRVTMLGDQYVYRYCGNVVRGIVKIDPHSNPKTIDILDDEGPYQGQLRQGIYRLEGDEMEVCMALPDQPRPTEFSTERGTGQLLHVFRRQRMQED